MKSKIGYSKQKIGTFFVRLNAHVSANLKISQMAH